MSDKVKDEIRTAIDSIEGKLKDAGFSSEDLEELKLDLEVGVKNNASNKELINILKASEEKVITKSKNKSQTSAAKKILEGTDFTKNYESKKVENLELSVNEVNIEELEQETEIQNTALENTITQNNQYFSQTKSGFENESVQYATNINEIAYVQEDAIKQANESYHNIQKRDDEEKKKQQNQMRGRSNTDIYN